MHVGLPEECTNIFSACILRSPEKKPFKRSPVKRPGTVFAMSLCYLLLEPPTSRTTRPTKACNDPTSCKVVMWASSFEQSWLGSDFVQLVCQCWKIKSSGKPKRSDFLRQLPDRAPVQTDSNRAPVQIVQKSLPRSSADRLAFRLTATIFSCWGTDMSSRVRT